MCRVRLARLELLEGTAMSVDFSECDRLNAKCDVWDRRAGRLMVGLLAAWVATMVLLATGVAAWIVLVPGVAVVVSGVVILVGFSRAVSAYGREVDEQCARVDDEIAVHPDGMYPDKVKAPRCGPCFEVDLDGSPK